MNEPGCRSWREELIDVALGRRAAGDLPAFQAHLDGCPACRSELGELGSVAATLADVDIDAELPPTPSDLGSRVAERVQTERSNHRRRQWVAGAAAAAAVIIMIIGLTFAFRSGDDGEPIASDPVDLTVALSGTTASGSADFVIKGWGTEIVLTAEGLAVGDPYQAWLSPEVGDRVSAGTFLMVEGGMLQITLASALPLADASGIWVTDADGETVLAAGF
ncbi:MAG: zf-HC2 domain-containing protein [Acidimicrobiia bacterium]|nr:zf-HC2 domain-containing protein [Acidimicrobiia bacterium]